MSKRAFIKCFKDKVNDSGEDVNVAFLSSNELLGMYLVKYGDRAGAMLEWDKSHGTIPPSVATNSLILLSLIE